MTELRQQMIDALQIAGLSEGTQQAYVRAVRQLAQHYDKSPDRLCERQLRQYLLFLKNGKKFAPASLKIAFSGIRFFYAHCPNRR